MPTFYDDEAALKKARRKQSMQLSQQRTADRHQPDERRRQPKSNGVTNHATSRTSTQVERRPANYDAPPSAAKGLHRKSWGHLRKRSSANAAAPPPPPPEPQGPSTYYQDPETRRQLKQCLASPHMFEEALRYGFPTAPTHDEALASRGIPKECMGRHKKSSSRAQPGRASSDAQRFMRNETLDFLDNPTSPELSDDPDSQPPRRPRRHQPIDVDHYRRESARKERQEYDAFPRDSDTESDIESPVTPGGIDQLQNLRIVQQHSLGSSFSSQYDMQPSTALPPYPMRISSREWQGAAWPGQREMTIRMTLTKPELRDPEDPRYGHRPRPSAVYVEKQPPTVYSEEIMAASQDTAKKGRVRSMLRRLTIERKEPPMI